MRLLVVIIGFALMLVILRYRGQIHNFTGEFGFAEKYLGAGGTHIFIIFVALATFVVSLMYAMGTLQKILNAVLGGFF